MAATADERQLRHRLHRIESLLKEVEASVDPGAKGRTKEVVQLLMDLHGAGLERIMERLASAGASGAAQIVELAKDDLIASLLLLYGLHPLDLEQRVGQALESVRPYLHSHGGNVELIGVAGGVVRLRLQGSCDGCPSSAMTLKQTIEEAIYEKAPDVAGVEVEDQGLPAPSTDRIVSGGSGGARMSLPILAR